MQAAFDLLQHLFGDEGFPLTQLQPAEELQRFTDGKIRHFADVESAHGHGKAFFFQPCTAAAGAGFKGHIFFEFLTDIGGIRFFITPFVIVDQPFPGRIVDAAVARGVDIFHTDLFAAGAVKQNIHLFFCEILDGRSHGKAVFPAQSFNTLLIPTVHIADIQRHNSAFGDGKVLIGDHKIRIDLHRIAETVAFGASPEGIVKGKHTGRHFPDADITVGTGEIAAEQQCFTANDLHFHEAVGLFQRQFHGIGQTLIHIGAHHQAVHHDGDIMFHLLFQDDLLIEAHHFTVDENADKPFLFGVFE